MCIYPYYVVQVSLIDHDNGVAPPLNIFLEIKQHNYGINGVVGLWKNM